MNHYALVDVNHNILKVEGEEAFHRIKKDVKILYSKKFLSSLALQHWLEKHSVQEKELLKLLELESQPCIVEFNNETKKFPKGQVAVTYAYSKIGNLPIKIYEQEQNGHPIQKIKFHCIKTAKRLLITKDLSNAKGYYNAQSSIELFRSLEHFFRYADAVKKPITFLDDSFIEVIGHFKEKYSYMLLCQNFRYNWLDYEAIVQCFKEGPQPRFLKNCTLHFYNELDDCRHLVSNPPINFPLTQKEVKGKSVEKEPIIAPKVKTKKESTFSSTVAATTVETARTPRLTKKEQKSKEKKEKDKTVLEKNNNWYAVKAYIECTSLKNINVGVIGLLITNEENQVVFKNMKNVVMNDLSDKDLKYIGLSMAIEWCVSNQIKKILFNYEQEKIDKHKQKINNAVKEHFYDLLQETTKSGTEIIFKTKKGKEKKKK